MKTRHCPSVESEACPGARSQDSGQDIHSPGEDLAGLELASLIDSPVLQALMDDFYKLARIPMSIIDLKGAVLVGAGWQEVCMKFHRIHPESCRHCIESDTQLSAEVPVGEYKLYKCKNNMWDVVTPIMVDGRHVGNIFSGQFFFDDEVPDYDFFRVQARRYGFDEERYIDALDRVPRLSREAVETGMGFFMKLADLISRLSLGNIRLARSLAERDELKRSAERLAESLEIKVRERTLELERKNQELQDFAHVASHDLQEPLRKIQSFGQRLRTQYADALGDQGRDYLQRMESAAGRMSRLISDLLGYSRVSTHASPFQLVDLGESSREAVADLERLVEETGGRVEVGDLPTVEADPSQMRQLFLNLIGNGLKFHSAGEPPVVRVLQGGDGQNGDVRTVLVEDNGIGFEERYTDRIFQPFQRLHGRSEYEGTGIGLAIVRKIVERHGGTVTATSEPGRGSRFTVTLPARQDGAAG